MRTEALAEGAFQHLVAACAGRAGPWGQFDRADQAMVADVDDVGMGAAQRMQPLLPVPFQLQGAGEQAFFLVGIERG